MLFDKEVCIGKVLDKNRYYFSVRGLCYNDFAKDCAESTFSEMLSQDNVEFILPHNIAAIFDYHFKVKVRNKDERDKVVAHLVKAGFRTLGNHGNMEVIGLLIGRANIAEINFPDVFDEPPIPEITIEEVFGIEFFTLHGK